MSIAALQKDMRFETMSHVRKGPRQPRKPPVEPEQTVISIRVSRVELDAFHRAAEEVGVPMASWARTVMRRAAGLKAL